MLSQTEENYLKCIYKLSVGDKGVNTNAISAAISTTAASVTDMLKKLADKGLLDYVRYKGVTLTQQGRELAVGLIRKHRLWEAFLAQKLQIGWDEVHDIAEQLEHIHSPLLIQRLDEFLGFPKFDPHGDPIPDQYGNYSERSELLLSQLKAAEQGRIVGVREHTQDFLQYLALHELMLGCELSVLQVFPYDKSVEIRTSSGLALNLSAQVAGNIFVSRI